MITRRAARSLFSTLALSAALAGRPAAQDPVWVAFDESPPGTEAEVGVVPEMSSGKRSTVEVRIHGFWREDVTAPDGTVYQRLDFPGLRRMTTPGAPELPEMRMLLAVPTDATQARLISETVQGQAFVSNLRVYPAPIPGEDEEIDPTGDPGPGDPLGTEETFTIDAGIYAGGIWPVADGVDGDVEPLVGPISGASVAGWPVSWDPSSERLIVATHVEYTFDHGGSTGSPLTITKVQQGLHEKLFGNWSEVNLHYPFDAIEYHSRYLIVAQPQWWDTLEPFVFVKKAQGYQVTVETALSDVASIRGVIADWYAKGDPGMDHFCMLVGDTLTIPQTTLVVKGENVPTDDVYAAIGPVNGSKEVHVGRLSVDNETDLANQLQKIIDYQVDPIPGARYDTALLVAHEENYPFKYTQSHLSVMSSSYVTPPTFLSVFGGTGGTNQQVSNFITAGQFGGGVGLVAYRGHGSTRAWTGWNTADQDYHVNDVLNLSNPVHPVVWAFTCTNANIDWGWGTNDDSIAEAWMEMPNSGAVASYGATRTTSTTPNHFLNETMFDVVYDMGVTTHGMAIAVAEAFVWLNWPGHKNPWAYLLLGDPSMTIRRERVEELEFSTAPATLSLDQIGWEVGLQALNKEQGAPLADGLISFYKPSFLAGADDEMSGALWTGDTGEATVHLQFETPGVLTVMARDLAGAVVTQEIPILMGSAWTDLGEGLGGAGAPPRMVGVGGLAPGSPMSLLATDAPAATLGLLCVGASTLHLPLLGGVLVPDIVTPPGLVLPVPTDELGNMELDGTWPTGMTSGAELVFQAWFVDPSGPEGLVATNGLVGRTP